MKSMLFAAVALTLLAGLTGAYAWDQQATDDQISTQMVYGQGPSGSVNYVVPPSNR